MDQSVLHKCNTHVDTQELQVRYLCQMTQEWQDSVKCHRIDLKRWTTQVDQWLDVVKLVTVASVTRFFIPLSARWNWNKCIDDASIFMKFDAVILSKILIVFYM